MQALLEPGAARAASRPRGRLPFGFGPRFFLLLLVGLMWIVPAFWNLRFLFVMAGWDLLALVAWTIDMARLRSVIGLIVERTWAGPLSLRNETQVSLTITNSSKLGLQCSILDDVPSTLRREPPRLVSFVPGNGMAVCSYQVRPLERGDIEVGSAYVRYQTSARFAERWIQADLRQKVRVYPDLEEARSHNLYLTRARQIELEKRLVRQRGSGRDFESLREYQPGDEVRDISWTATARRGKHVTRIYQVERSQAVWIIVDSGRLLRARVGELSKLDFSVNAALTLAQLALYSGDRVGLIAYGRKSHQRVGLGRGLPHMRAILETLAVIPEEASEADHMRAASSLLQTQKRRSLVVWITDLAETSMTPEVIESASQMLSRHLLLFVVIAQLDLIALAGKRPENPEELFRVVAAQEMLQRRDLLLARIRDRGALALEVSPHQLTTTLVNQYLEVKERSLI